MNFEKVADSYLRNLSDRKFSHLFCEHDVFIVKDHSRLYQREFVDQNRVKEVQTGKLHYIYYYWFPLLVEIENTPISDNKNMLVSERTNHKVNAQIKS